MKKETMLIISNKGTFKEGGFMNHLKKLIDKDRERVCNKTIDRVLKIIDAELDSERCKHLDDDVLVYYKEIAKKITELQEGKNENRESGGNL